MDVEDVRGTLAPYHALLREQLEHYGGTVEKFIGDAVMALFGAPGDARGRSRAGGPRGALDPGGDRPAERARSPASTCTSAWASTPARRWSSSAPTPAAERGWRPATSSTPPPASSPPRRSTASWSARRPTAPRIARSPTGRPSRSSRRASPSRCPPGRRSRRGPGSGVDVVQRPTTPLVGPRGRGRPAPRRPPPLPGRARRAARHARGRPRDRQEPARLGALRGGRARSGLHHLAPGPFAPLRRGRDLLGAGRDDQRPGRASSTPTPPRRPRRKLRATVADLIDDPAEAAWVEEHVRALAGLETGGAARRRPPQRGRRGLAPLPRGAGGAASARARVRGPALGRRRAPGLRRPPRRLGERRADARRLHRPPGAARSAARVGRRQAKRAHDRPLAARRTPTSRA